jgi:murein DD-endopeptidase MepM/ murein hydrolase activator NlpD
MTTHELSEFFSFLYLYLKKKVHTFSRHFEKNKNRLVKVFLMKRGRYNRPFLHLATMSVLGIGVIIAPFLADTYPVFSSQSTLQAQNAAAEAQSVNTEQDVFRTQTQQIRSTPTTYTVQKGDTLSTIASKFSSPKNPISEDTIRWANDISGDDISVGDELTILPVSGVMHKVEKGDTIYSISKKYSVNPQVIADYPFNDFANPETFSLVEGQMIMVPGGVVQSADTPVRQVASPYIARGNASPVSTGGFFFPLPHNTGISQYASWYHMALDITAPVGTPIYAAHSGTVTYVSVGGWDTGYGTNVWISDGQGTESHYAHMSSISVSVGQHVTGGSSMLGLSGNTGRSTGPHCHFEIRRNGSLVDPLAYVGNGG